MSIEESIANIRYVADNWPDGVHSCAELQRLEPGRRSCTCGTCACHYCKRGGPDRKFKACCEHHPETLVCLDAADCRDTMLARLAEQESRSPAVPE